MQHFFVIKEWPQQKEKSDTTCSLRTKHEAAVKKKNGPFLSVTFCFESFLCQ